MTTRWALFAASAALLTAACPSTTDLGQPCVLVRKDPADTDPSDGYRSIAIKEGEITQGKDFISFGATECEDLVCVRDANAPTGTDPNAPARGICSHSCVETSADTCDTGNGSIDRDPERAYSCKALLLDADTLAAMKESNPEKYAQYFPSNTTPFFCVGPALE